MRNNVTGEHADSGTRGGDAISGSPANYYTNRVVEHLAHHRSVPRGFPFTKSWMLLVDSVAVHHSKAVEEFVAETGVELLLVPADSRWRKPVEGSFSVVERYSYIR